jgi:hypothetical protein
MDTNHPTLSTRKVLRVVLDTNWSSKSRSLVLRVPPVGRFLKRVVDFLIMPNYCVFRMKSTARYHLKDNLRVSINQRLSLTERVARANAIRVARDYARFRQSLNLKLKD